MAMSVRSSTDYDCNGKAVAILSIHYSSLSLSLSDPVSVARLLCGEHVITEAALANVESTSQSALSETRNLLLAAVREAVHTDYQSLHTFGTVLCKFTDNIQLGKAILYDYAKSFLDTCSCSWTENHLQRSMEDITSIHSVEEQNLVLKEKVKRLEQALTQTKEKNEKLEEDLKSITEQASMTAEYHFKMKLVLIGDSGVGKSNLLSRFTKNKFTHHTPATVGTGYATKVIKTIDGNIIQVRIWDTAGAERHRALSDMFYRDAVGVLLVYDITDKKSYENKRIWLEDLKEYAADNIIIVLIGNKCDLEHERFVPTVKGKKFADEHEYGFMETSALDSTNVEAAFQTIITEIYDKGLATNCRDLEQTITIENEDRPMEEKKCCGIKRKIN